ncbi:MspA family porin [Mycobacterium sp. MYCO198283]|uniref:MspA family porin n=1 Tax=Mycobacterium sp. MYCO198283 TaxID=2883505 RepID=UPI001E5EB896|nr:MspA family porin [Mycobacterium sp. MYCO198283]MCG5432436.1 MspA family porin [Mycobacterium sp. MYCO198283]
MHIRSATAAACMVLSVGLAPVALADPPPPPAVPLAADGGAPPPPSGPALPQGPIESAPAGVLNTPDGWTVTVAGSAESMEPVAPLTTALSSREYLVDGSFTGNITGKGKTKLAGGSLEAGYRIGCGINGGPVELQGGIGITPGLTGLGPNLNAGGNFGGTLVSGQIKINLKPGTVNIVPVDKKSFKGTSTRINITGFRVKVDNCVGQSFIQSYATLTSSTDNSDDVITYLGVVRAI